MTEMMDMSSDLVGSGIPFLDYKKYAERIFFPGHRESPLRRDLDVQECRRQTVEQGLVQLSNLLNSKLFLTKVRRVELSLCRHANRAVLLFQNEWYHQDMERFTLRSSARGKRLCLRMRPRAVPMILFLSPE